MWRVYDAGELVVLSEHTNATEAEFVALARAEDRGDQRVVVHDRYHRTRDASPGPSRSEPSIIVSPPGPDADRAQDPPSWELPWWIR